MPLEWKHGNNPYRVNHFNILKIGPRATLAQLVQKAKQRCQEIKVSSTDQIANVEIDEYMINEAVNKLREPTNRIEEMLLVHAPPQQNQKRLKSLIKKLEDFSDLPDEFPELVLVHPMAVLWFLPSPGPDAAKLPEWDEFGLSKAGDEEDRALDIVYDI